MPKTSRLKLAVLALLPAVALAAPPPATKRFTVLLVPLDKGAEQSVPKFEAWMLGAMAAFPGVTLRSPDELFGLPGDEAAEASLKRAEQGFEESRRAFEANKLEDAERKLRATLQEFHSAAGALTQCGHFCDALAMAAAVQQRRGQEEQAKLTLLDLLALEPTYELSPKRVGREIVALRAQIATGRSADVRGNANVITRPAGARVYLDGEFKGYAPLSLQMLQIGKHLLRVERPGFKRYGKLIEITADDLEVVADLTPTPAWKAWDAQMDKVAAEASKGGGTSLTQLAKSLGLDHAVIGTVKSLGENGRTELAVGLFDLRSGRQIAQRKAVYQGDEFGQLEAEVGRFVNALLTTDAKGKVARGGDPLESTSGTEEWNAEDRGGQTSIRSKKNSGDPLDGVSGMEDW